MLHDPFRAVDGGVELVHVDVCPDLLFKQRDFLLVAEIPMGVPEEGILPVPQHFPDWRGQLQTKAKEGNFSCYNPFTKNFLPFLM